MKTFVLISRLLLGLLFLVFGLNGFLHFIPAPMPTGIAGQYVGALFISHYLHVVFALELVAGVLLLTNRFVPAVIAVVLWSVLFYRERAAFSALLVAKGTV
jgi:putative oxidoreductase